MALRATAPRQGEGIHVAQRGGFFPLTPALSPGERVTLSRPRAQSKPVGFPLRDAPCSLSLRERVRVRGNGVNYSPSYRLIPEISHSASPPVEPDASRMTL